MLDITLNNDDGLPNLICEKCKWRVESLENHTEVAEEHEKSFSGFSVGFCINEEEGYLLPTIARKITCRCFN